MKKGILGIALGTIPAIVVMTSSVWADSTIYVGPADQPVVVQPAPPPVMVQPATPVTVVQPTQPAPTVVVRPAAQLVRIELPPPAPNPSNVVVPETLQVDGISARQVRAHAIYANRIDADRVQGVIHQISGLTTLYGHGQIQAADVAASTIYADTINANVVVADAVYVRDLRVR